MGFASQQVVDVLQGEVVAFLLGEDVGAKDEVGLVLGGEDERLGEVLLGFLKLPRLAIDIAARVVRPGLERVALDGGVAVLLRARVVAQLNLGDGT